ncbi:MAG: glycosyltransferase family 2 protein [Desulfamplus sp.]|nr:glycosyltransferase family 2 protein [Desulfamplus sp.]
MLISTLLVSHNNQKDLQLLLPSLKRALKDIPNEILLVDNCSTDSTVKFVQTNFPDIFITINSKQMGYGANQNQNISRARGKFILLMNPDMIVPDNLFNVMVRFMEKHKDAAIATCKICNEDGSCQYLNKREPAILDLCIRRFLPPRLKQILPSKLNDMFTERVNYYEMRDIGYDHVVNVPFVSGSFIFAKADTIKALNGFDERFFMYFEDVDLCRRVSCKDHCLYCPDVSVVHRWERASHKSLKWTLVFILSGLKYFHKWGFKFF